jgi:hypothetical protein
MTISNKYLAMLEIRHNVIFTDEQIAFLDFIYTKRTQVRLPLHAFAWAVYMALNLYPAPGQRPLFVHSPSFEQLKLESFDDFTD